MVHYDYIMFICIFVPDLALGASLGLYTIRDWLLEFNIIIYS